ncbi:MAG: SRPBCC family protein [Hyphomicrobiaceae bacterium]
MSDRIVKTVEIDAPVSRVWQAISDHEQFGQWFRVKLDQPFTPGDVSTGKMTYPGFEGYPWLAQVVDVTREQRLAFRWVHSEPRANAGIEDLPTTLVEFLLEPVGPGTRLTIIESGFEAFPDPQRLEFLRRNTEGWNIQANNVATYVASQS